MQTTYGTYNKRCTSRCKRLLSGNYRQFTNKRNSPTFMENIFNADTKNHKHKRI